MLLLLKRKLSYEKGSILAKGGDAPFSGPFAPSIHLPLSYFIFNNRVVAVRM